MGLGKPVPHHLEPRSQGNHQCLRMVQIQLSTRAQQTPRGVSIGFSKAIDIDAVSLSAWYQRKNLRWKLMVTDRKWMVNVGNQQCQRGRQLRFLKLSL